MHHDYPRAPAIEILAENLKVRRTDAQETQEAFAKRCGVTQKQLSAIERAVANPRLSTIDIIAARLSVSICALFRSSVKS